MKKNVTKEQFDEAFQFLEARVKESPAGTDGGLNQLPYKFFPVIAKLMAQFREEKQSRLEELEANQKVYVETIRAFGCF
jgi:hypothetical protein